MNGKTSYNQYMDSLKHMCGPYTKDDIPKIQLDLKGIVEFAKAHNKPASELTDDELAPFVLNATVEELRAAKLNPADKMLL